MAECLEEMASKAEFLSLFCFTVDLVLGASLGFEMHGFEESGG